MKRHIVLGSLAMVGLLTMAVGASEQPPPTPSADAITVEKVKDNLFVLRGGGGNTAVFVTATGVTLVDTKNPGWGQPLLDKVKTLTNKPVTTVINTHTHYDHVSGNVEMPTVVDIVAHENTKMLMNEMKDVYGLAAQPNVFKDKAGRGLGKQIGRAAGRGRGEISGGAGSFKKKKEQKRHDRQPHKQQGR